MPRLINRNPAYRLHKSDGRAVVTIDGRDYYLGEHGSTASRREYDRLIGEWLAGGRRLASKNADMTVTEICAAYWLHAQKYYRAADGSMTSEVSNIKSAMRPLRKMYGPTPANDFRPLALKALQHEMIRMGWVRTNINRQIHRIKLIFKWAAANELLPPSICHGLQAVDSLKMGRTDAGESDPVRPVPDAYVAAVLQVVSRQVRGMISLQLHSGMRPGEMCAMTTGRIDTAGKVWAYRPAAHKTQHRGHDRIIYLGPKAQAILKPFLKTDLAAPIFSPADAEQERRAKASANRKTPLSCGNRPGSNVVRRPKREPGEVYDVDAYRRAIARACDVGFPPPAPLAQSDDESAAQWMKRLTKQQRAELAKWRRDHRWHPHQLRHNAATFLRREYGIDAAKVILGHRTLSATQIYAEADQAKAMKIVGEVG